MSIQIIFSGRTHKESETITDCQDFFHQNLEQHCIAIADGASQSFYPSLWAELLVNHFCQNPDITPENWQLWLKPIQEKWLQKVQEKVETAQRDLTPVWVTNINRLNRRDSATSTFIGLKFLDNKIKVSLVGDSCLFIVKNHDYKNTLIASYPLENSQDFGNRPEYFASYEKDNDFKPQLFDLLFENQKNSEKYYFILATDALSEFIFQCLENEKDIWDYLIAISSENEFESFVKEVRNSQDVKMKNDDVTLMILEVNNIKIFQPLPSINPPTEKQINTLLLTKTISGEEEKVNQVENEPTRILALSEFNNNAYNNRETITPNEQNQVRDLKKINRSLKLQRNILLFILVLSLPLLTYFLLKKSANQNIVNSNERISTSDNSNNIESSSSTNKSDQIPPDNQNNIDLPTSNESEINKPKSIEIEVGTKIYKDEQLSEILIESTQTKVNTPIIETGENWIKILRNVYAHKSTSPDENCTNKEITLIENIRIEGYNNAPLFGKLKQPSQFQNLDIDNQLDWCKFRFEGYIKK